MLRQSFDTILMLGTGNFFNVNERVAFFILKTARVTL